MAKWPNKDPQEVLDYDIDWSARLDTGDEVSNSSWVIDDDDETLTIDSDTFSDTATKVWLSGGTLGVTYSVTNTIATNGGRTHELTVKLKIKEK